MSSSRKAMQKVCLIDHVFAIFDDTIRDLLRQSNHVEWLVFEQATQDDQLRAQHIAFGHGRYYFPGCGFDFVQ